MCKDTSVLPSPIPNSWYAVRWLRAQEESRLTAWKTIPEREAQALVKRAIRRDPEPQYRMADLTVQEEQTVGQARHYLWFYSELIENLDLLGICLTFGDSGSLLLTD